MRTENFTNARTIACVLSIVVGRNPKGRNFGKVSAWKSACAILLLGAATTASPAQSLTTLLSFTDGAEPQLMSLIQGTDGNLYGTTSLGGTNGYGTVFKITPAGVLKTLYSLNGADGSFPTSGLVQGVDGNFYGTTVELGANGYGTIFKMTPQGTLNAIYSFCAQPGCTDGGSPDAALVQATDGNFYGTTQVGGTNGYGTVFRITPTGTLTTLYSFCPQTTCPDGSYPNAGLVQASNGSLYGTTYSGGTSQSCFGGCGTVFKITLAGVLTTLHSFDRTDGDEILSSLIQGADGNFYGTTSLGGDHGAGTIFKVTSGGVLTTLHSFDGTDGLNVYAGVIQATDTSLYGTTYNGGAQGSGTVFKLTLGGALTTLYSFCAQSNCTDGANPSGGLLQATNGNLYGTTQYGGAGAGTAFRLTVGLRPFVETRPTSGKVGASVIILGTNLTGATSVTFNGTSAKFEVVSKSEIRTTVPNGATTGKVKVTTPGRKLSSNVPFRVRK